MPVPGLEMFMLGILEACWRPLGASATSSLGVFMPLLAEEAAAAAKKTPAPTGGSIADMLPALAIIMVMFYFLILRPQKNKDQQFKQLISRLKETDRVVTIGGIHGIVVNVQPETEMVTIRVDESTGTKIRVSTSAIARVITDEDKAT